MVGPREVPRTIVGQIVSSQFPQTDCMISRFGALRQIAVEQVRNPGKESISLIYLRSSLGHPSSS